jgi:hypothetical protein
VARKRDDEMASAPPPGTAKAAPRVTKGKAAAQVAATAAIPAEAPRVVNRLADSHAEMLRAALRDLGDARKLLDPSVSR